jgi:SM-20-related protein
VSGGWLNPTLKPDDYALAFAADGVVQIEDVLESDVATALADVMERGVDWRLAYSDPRGGHVMLTRAEMAAVGQAGLARRVQAVTAQASRGFGYLYYVYPMVEAYVRGEDPGHPLHGLTEFLNSPEFMDFARAVTGETVVKVDAQASRYGPGHFLNLHDDLGEGQRRAAYTLGLTRDWRTDWGGQLLFHDARGDVSRGFIPRFNVLTLFKVPMQHSVAPVAPYAAAPRLTIAGWLRDDPAYAEVQNGK